MIENILKKTFWHWDLQVRNWWYLAEIIDTSLQHVVSCIRLRHWQFNWSVTRWLPNSGTPCLYGRMDYLSDVSNWSIISKGACIDRIKDGLSCSKIYLSSLLKPHLFFFFDVLRWYLFLGYSSWLVFMIMIIAKFYSILKLEILNWLRRRPPTSLTFSPQFVKHEYH